MRDPGRLCLLALLLALACPRAEAGSSLPLSLDQAQGLLQKVVDKLFLKGFRRLGDPADFDHGHVLLDGDQKPVAILYHTQELARYRAGDYGYLDPDGRNWLQWLATGVVEKADRYQRKEYPATERWRRFQQDRLPGFKRHFTITDEMLDPALLGFEVAASRQWVFRVKSCEETGTLRLRLPTGPSVCLNPGL